MTKVGVIFSPYDYPPESLPGVARAAETAGISALWLWEDCFRQSAFASASAALAWTDELRVGIGISPMPLRNVALHAMEIATLARMFPSRILPGVGHGVLSHMNKAGARVSSPLTLMREYIPALRSLLQGNNVTVEGRYVSLSAVELGWPPEVPPPVYAAAEGPKTLALSGEVADGTILDCDHSIDHLAFAVATIRKSRATAEVRPDTEVLAYLRTSPSGGIQALSADGQRAPVPGSDDRRVSLSKQIDRLIEAVQSVGIVGIDSVALLPSPSVDLIRFCSIAGEVARAVS